MQLRGHYNVKPGGQLLSDEILEGPGESVCEHHCTTFPVGPLACGDVIRGPMIINHTLCKLLQSGASQGPAHKNKPIPRIGTNSIKE